MQSIPNENKLRNCGNSQEPMFQATGPEPEDAQPPDEHEVNIRAKSQLFEQVVEIVKSYPNISDANWTLGQSVRSLVDSWLKRQSV